MWISLKSDVSNHPPFDIRILEVTLVKVLGFLLDFFLTWQMYVDSVLTDGKKCLGQLHILLLIIFWMPGYFHPLQTLYSSRVGIWIHSILWYSLALPDCFFLLHKIENKWSGEQPMPFLFYSSTVFANH